MGTLSNKIDFAVIMTVKKANPNGDPLDGNRPRVDFQGYGEISDVCIKRKIRNRLQDMGERVFVQSSDRCDDGAKSLNDRATRVAALDKAMKAKDGETCTVVACKEWIDVRAFGQLFAFSDSKSGKKNDTENKKEKGLSVGIRGPVSVRTAESVTLVDISTMQIIKSVNGETKETKSSDTMGYKNRVEFGLYVCFGSINPQLAEKTGFSEEDAEKIKAALTTLFENDASAARPDGSMEVRRVFWWQHNCRSGQYSSAKVHRSLKIQMKPGIDQPHSYEDYTITVDPLEGLTPQDLTEECR